MDWGIAPEPDSKNERKHLFRKLLRQKKPAARGMFASAAGVGHADGDIDPSRNQGDSRHNEKISKTKIKLLGPGDVWHPRRGAPLRNQNAVTHGRQTAEIRAMRAEVWQAIRRSGALIALAKAHLAAQHGPLSFDSRRIPASSTNPGKCSVTGLRDIRHTSEKSLADQVLPLDRPGESDKVNQLSGELPSGGGMIKSELVARLSQRYPHLYHRDVERIVTTVLDEISKALAQGHRVELRGFGAFSVKVRPSRVGRNPRTGEAVQVAAKKAPFFRTGKELRERLNAHIAVTPPKQPADTHIGP